jgi:hypothetical protein
MSPFPDARVAAPSSGLGGRTLLHWICTSNPFYVLSAGLFLMGLRISFGAPTEATQTWALMSGLTGYTLLLAVTACLLVRFGRVWDDARTVLLLVVLMLLATSLTFDEVLIIDPERGFACFLIGFLFAIAVSEGLLWGMRLRLPAWFRTPYYLILALFFFYPPGLTPLVDEPRGEALTWGLFGFPALAGVAFLTLLPAVRLGPAYVRANGSPWGWPLYPWTLFGLLAAAVPARSFLLCLSMQLLNNDQRERSIFGPFFLVPFGLAIAILLLEIGIVSWNRKVLWTALVLPLGLASLTVLGHRDDPIYREFLDVFTDRFGVDPLAAILLASVAFSAYALLRRVPQAATALTLALVAVSVVGPDTLNQGRFVAPQPTPLLALAALHLWLGIQRRSSASCSIGIASLIVAVLGSGLDDVDLAPYRDVLAFHLVVLGIVILGAVFEDTLARLARWVGAGLVTLTALAVLSGWHRVPAMPVSWAMDTYPLVMGLLLVGYGLLLPFRPALALAGVVLTGWSALAGWQMYRFLRGVVAGLDHLALSLALFVLALLISLGKSGLLSRWLAERRGWRLSLQTPIRRGAE